MGPESLLHDRVHFREGGAALSHGHPARETWHWRTVGEVGPRLVSSCVTDMAHPVARNGMVWRPLILPEGAGLEGFTQERYLEWTKKTHWNPTRWERASQAMRTRGQNVLEPEKPSGTTEATFRAHTGRDLDAGCTQIVKAGAEFTQQAGVPSTGRLAGQEGTAQGHHRLHHCRQQRHQHHQCSARKPNFLFKKVFTESSPTSPRPHPPRAMGSCWRQNGPDGNSYTDRATSASTLSPRVKHRRTRRNCSLKPVAQLLPGSRVTLVTLLSVFQSVTVHLAVQNHSDTTNRSLSVPDQVVRHAVPGPRSARGACQPPGAHVTAGSGR